jgi:hypothetical protein
MSTSHTGNGARRLTGEEEHNRLERVEKQRQRLAHDPCEGHDEPEDIINIVSQQPYHLDLRNDEQGDLLMRVKWDEFGNKHMG